MKNNQNTMKVNNSLYTTSTVPFISYANADTQKSDILKDNRKKTGIYR
jgi:hypothetical protein